MFLIEETYIDRAIRRHILAVHTGPPPRTRNLRPTRPRIVRLTLLLNRIPRSAQHPLHRSLPPSPPLPRYQTLKPNTTLLLVTIQYTNHSQPSAFLQTLPQPSSSSTIPDSHHNPKQNTPFKSSQNDSECSLWSYVLRCVRGLSLGSP